MNDNQLRQFICVANEKNLTKASEILHISQQALSKAMSSLEEELGAALFLRSGKGTNLTNVGEEILPVAESMLSKNEEHMAIISRIIERSKGTISLLFEHQFMPYVIPPDFLSRIGNLRIKSAVAGGFDECIQEVLNGAYELGFVHKPDEMVNLEYIPVICEHMQVLMNKKHVLANKETISIMDLEDVDLLSPATYSALFKSFIRACVDNGFYPNFIFEHPDLELLLRSVSSNIGVTVGASFGLMEGYQGDIVVKPLVHDSLMMEVGFIANPDYREKLHLNSFVRAICSYYSS